MDGHLRSARLYFTPILAVDLVHGCEVVHIGEEDVDFYNLVEVGAGRFKDGTKVLDTLVLYR